MDHLFPVFVDQGYHEVLELYDLDKDPSEEHNLATSSKLAASSKLEELMSLARSLVVQMVGDLLLVIQVEGVLISSAKGSSPFIVL
jgi:hypothetical protein